MPPKRSRLDSLIFTPANPSSLLADLTWLLLGTSHAVLATYTNRISTMVQGPSARDVMNMSTEEAYAHLLSNWSGQGKQTAIAALPLPLPFILPLILLSTLLFLTLLFRSVIQHSRWRYSNRITTLLYALIIYSFALKYPLGTHCNALAWGIIVERFSWGVLVIAGFNVAVHWGLDEEGRWGDGVDDGDGDGDKGVFEKERSKEELARCCEKGWALEGFDER